MNTSHNDFIDIVLDTEIGWMKWKLSTLPGDDITSNLILSCAYYFIRMI